ncbi:MAG: response regulator [Candidatus Thermoplasmatota archaeon]
MADAGRLGTQAVAVAVLVLTVAATLGAATLARDAGRAASHLSFEGVASDLRAALQERLTTQVLLLEGVRGLFVASDAVNRAEFGAYMNSIERVASAGVQAIGFVPWIPVGELAAHVAAVRAEGFPNYTVFPSTSGPFAPITFIEPFAGTNLLAIGFDMASDPVRGTSLFEASNTGNATLTAPIVLAQDQNVAPQPGLLLYLPVYRNGAEVTTPESRRLATVGWVFVAVRAADVMGNLLPSGADQRVQLTDGPTATGKVLYASHGDEGLLGAADLIEVEIMHGGRQWTLSVATFDMPGVAFPLTVLLSGLFASAVLTAVVWRSGLARKKAETLVHERTTELQAVLHGANDGVLTFDARPVVESANPAFLRMLGYRTEQIVGHPANLVRDPGDASAATDVADLENPASPLFQRPFERVLQRSNGEKITVEVSLSRLPLASGTRFVAILRDATERARVRQALDEALRNAEAMAQAKSDFLANMSHEIRTPMNAILGLSDLLAQSKLTDMQRDYITTIQASGKHLLGLIDEVLDYSKVEAGKLVLDLRPTAIVDLIESALDLVSPRAAERDLALGYLPSSTLPRAVVVDASRLRQILLNLLSNAIKFTAQGEVVVEAAGTKDGEAWILEFSVRDTGLGIAAQDIERLFHPFTQVDSSTTRVFGGTGLGLAISRRLVEMMGGRIWVESTPGKGSTFRFTLRATEAVVPSPVDPAHLVGQRVLVVDDNQTNRTIFRANLEQLGMVVELAPGPTEALEQLRRGATFDLLLLDHHMPKMDGIELLRAMRSLGVATPAIITSSVGHQPTLAPDDRVSAFLSKPVKRSRLAAAVRDALDGRSTVQPEAAKPEAAASRLRILVVEDQAVNRTVLLRMLENLGATADVASDGRQAVEAATRIRYDLIFMDVQMPILDGIEAARQIRRLPGGAWPNIVALTAAAMPGDRQRALDAGMDGFVAKPVRLQGLAEALAKAGQGRGGRP